MPARNIPLVSDQVYHIFNKIQNGEPLFTLKSYCRPMINALWYYQYAAPSMKLSCFRHQSAGERPKIIESLHNGKRLVDILAYCLMPNHFHLLVQQKESNGVSLYMSKVQNSITRFINIKKKQKGHIFIGQFKAVRVEKETLLLHVSRYIHLNPYTGYVTRSIEETKKFSWSSYHEYVANSGGICQQQLILSHFKTKQKYEKFIESQKDYQRTLADIKHSIFE